MVGGVNVNCLWTDTITLYQTDVLSTHLVKLLIYVGTNVWGGHGVGEGAYFGYGKPAHPRGWAGCWQPRVPAVHPLMAEKHSEQIAPLERGEKKKVVGTGVSWQWSRSWVRLRVWGAQLPSQGAWAGLDAADFFFIYFYCFSLHSASISHPAPTFLGSEYYFYGAAMYWDNLVYASVVSLKTCCVPIIVGIIFVHIGDSNW